MRRLLSVLIAVLRILPFAALLFTALHAAAQDEMVSVEKVRSFREGEVFFTEFHTRSNWSVADVQARFSSDAVEIDLPHFNLGQNKQNLKVDDRVIQSVVISQADSSMVRARLVVREHINARSLDSRIRVRRHNGGVTIELSGDPTEKAEGSGGNPGGDRIARGSKGESLSVVRSLSVVNDDSLNGGLGVRLVAGGDAANGLSVGSTNSLNKSNELTSVPGSTVAPSVSASSEGQSIAHSDPTKADTSKLKESEIPVLTGLQNGKVSSTSNVTRLMMTLGVLVVLLGAVLLGLKRWAAQSAKKNVNTKIQVLTQHHLGPKKSLAIIQVAGESILIGMTDQNISMLKTLALIDDEVPENVPQRFDGVLEDYEDRENGSSRSGARRQNDSGEDEEFAMQGLAQIRDTVSSRLRGMRNL